MKNTSLMAIYKQVERAAKNGGINKPSCCEDCGKKSKLQGHHDNYDKPLSVRWLCAKCHRGLHKADRENKKIHYNKKLHQTELAKKLGVSPQYIWKVLHGHKRVSPQRAVEIEIASGGMISRHDLLPDVSSLFKN